MAWQRINGAGLEDCVQFPMFLTQRFNPVTVFI